MIRTEKYKWFDERGKQYLFDLEKDPFELNNLIDSSAHKELAATMKQKYLKFLLDTQYNYSAYYLPLVQRMKQETK
jgi:arylsulfatase A-like enzyme